MLTAHDKGQIPLERPETRVSDPVSDKVRSGSLGSPTSPRTLSGHRPFRSISTCTDFVWVWSSRGQSLRVRVVEFRNDTTRPDQRYCYHIWSSPRSGFWVGLHTSRDKCLRLCQRQSLGSRTRHVGDLVGDPKVLVGSGPVQSGPVGSL